MIFIVYAIRILVSTGLIYLSIAIVDRGNYRNKLSTAFFTAVFLGFAFQVPLFYWLGLVAWVYLLINWYSIGFFRSFLCAVVYAVLFMLLNIVLAGLIVGTAGIMAGQSYIAKEAVERVQRPTSSQSAHSTVSGALKSLPQKIKAKSHAITSQVSSNSADAPDGRQVNVILTNGRTIKGIILQEGADEYVLDIAGGGAEVVIRKDSVYRLEDI
jgi:hypothetical protein